MTILLFLGVVVQGFINFPSGYKYNGSLLFWSSHGHDGLWHVSLLEEIKKSLPLENPLLVGNKLYNYHYLSDVIFGEFGRIFSFFASLDLYFRFFPVVLSLLIGLGSYNLVKRWKRNEKTALWAMFFTYFAGSFGYVVTFINNRVFFAGETIFWASQNNSILGNPPHATAFALFLATSTALMIYLDNRKSVWLLIALWFSFLLGAFKVSAGLIVIAGLVSAGTIDWIVSKRKHILFTGLAVGFANAVVVKLMTQGITSFLLFEPWWFVRTMVVSPGRLNWIDLELRRQHYASLGTIKGWLRVIQVETQALFLFVVGNLGMKALGLIQIGKNLFTQFKKTLRDPFEIYLLSTASLAFLVPMLFVQKGITFNNIQFLQYFMLIIGFYAAIFVANVVEKIKSKSAKVFLFLALVFFATPTAIGNLFEFYGSGKTALAKITEEELAALEFVRNTTPVDSILLTVPYDGNLRYDYEDQPQPWPIYVWYSTSYVPALASRRTYLTSEEQIDITGYEFEERRENMKKFFTEGDLEWNREFLTKNGIDYIYIAKGEREKPLDEDGNIVSKFFENDSVIIYKNESN